MSISLDHRSDSRSQRSGAPRRPRKRWRHDEIAKVERLWKASHSSADIAAWLTADGLVITAVQVRGIISYHHFRGPRSKPLHSKEFIARIRSLWENGWSAGLIAASVKTLTRNAVIGLAHRHCFKRKTAKHITLS
jgi:hypothetical protein